MIDAFMNNRFSHLPALRWVFLIAVILFPLLAASPQRALAETTSARKNPGKTHKAVFQITDGDTNKWNLVLVNALNVLEALGRDKVKMEIVVYGPAIDMLRIESEVAPRVDEVIESGVRIIACENTMRGQHLTPADMLPNIHYTRSGVAYLMEKQEQGYAYIRP
jgi:hypothetical protein